MRRAESGLPSRPVVATIIVLVVTVIAVGALRLFAGPKPGLEHEKGSKVAAQAADALLLAGSTELQLGPNGSRGSFSVQAPDEAKGLAFVAPNSSSPVGDEVVSVDGRLFVFTAETSYSRTRGLFGPAVKAAPSRWIRLPTSANSDPRFHYLGLQKLAKFLRSPPGGYRPKVVKTLVDGQPAVEVIAADGAQLFVASSGPPLPLRLVEHPGDPTSEVTFAYYGVQATVAPPISYRDAASA